ncbi:protein diaphanous homolog 1-like [Nothobranchius furzeri]|uniref:Formin-like protein 5 n=1 Tax=Nothobranchius furzeri TaxID=105023 RepID=A0A9D2Z5J9_NOTFU|nr:formin-like protein 5 [Nothobranchius furzeri]
MASLPISSKPLRGTACTEALEKFAVLLAHLWDREVTAHMETQGKMRAFLEQQKGETSGSDAEEKLSDARQQLTEVQNQLSAALAETNKVLDEKIQLEHKINNLEMEKLDLKYDANLLRAKIENRQTELEFLQSKISELTGPKQESHQRSPLPSPPPPPAAAVPAPPPAVSAVGGGAAAAAGRRHFTPPPLPADAIGAVPPAGGSAPADAGRGHFLQTFQPSQYGPPLAPHSGYPAPQQVHPFPPSAPLPGYPAPQPAHPLPPPVLYSGYPQPAHLYPAPQPVHPYPPQLAQPTAPVPTADIYRMSRSVKKFSPRPGKSYPVDAYLSDLRHHFQRCPGMTLEDTIFLIRLTSDGVGLPTIL